MSESNYTQASRCAAEFFTNLEANVRNAVLVNNIDIIEVSPVPSTDFQIRKEGGRNLIYVTEGSFSHYLRQEIGKIDPDMIVQFGRAASGHFAQDCICVKIDFTTSDAGISLLQYRGRSKKLATVLENIYRKTYQEERSGSEPAREAFVASIPSKTTSEKTEESAYKPPEWPAHFDRPRRRW
jgi:hypothetical protein